MLFKKLQTFLHLPNYERQAKELEAIDWQETGFSIEYSIDMHKFENEKSYLTFHDHLMNNLRTKSNCAVAFNHRDPEASPSAKKRIIFDGKGLSRSAIAQLISAPYGQNILLRNFHIPIVMLQNGDYPDSSIEFENCVIGRLCFARASLAHSHAVTIRDSIVVKIELEESSVGNFFAQDSSFLGIACPPPHAPSPLHGSFQLKNVRLAPPASKLKATGAQELRNLRHHLVQLQNDLVASKVYRAELMLERPEDGRFNNAISRLYDLISLSGTSISRPIIWLLAILIFGSLFYYFTDSLTLRVPFKELVGWERIVAQNRLLQAVMYSVKATINPLDIFGPKSALTAESILVAVFHALHSLISIALIALSLLALRRRFRMKE